MKKNPNVTVPPPEYTPMELENRLWDEILKVIALKMPSQLLPLLNEAFQKDYPQTAHIEFLSTEYVTRKRRQSKQKYPSVFSDIVLRVEHTDIYHLECQMQNDKTMVVRMIEYDFSISLQHGAQMNSSGSHLSLHLPRSCVLYPSKNDQIPDVLLCEVIFPDGGTYCYEIPAIKVQSYDLKTITEKHLTIMLPFLLLRFRPRLKSETNPISKKELTDYVEQLIVVLSNELSQGKLTEKQYKQYIELINLSAEQIFNHNPDLTQEVNNMMKPLIELSDDKIERLTRQLKRCDAQLHKQENTLHQKDLIIEKLTAELAIYKQSGGITETVTENQ